MKKCKFCKKRHTSSLGQKICAIKHTSRKDFKPPVKSEPKKVDGYVYFIKCGDYVKIGLSQDYQARLKGMHTDNPFELVVICVFPTRHFKKMEKSLHNRFKKYHHRNEWFYMEDEILCLTERLDRSNSRRSTVKIVV